MANYEQLKASIIAAIYDNGNQEITGDVLQSVLLSIVNIIGANATFSGIAETGTIPGNVYQNAFYIALSPGYYSGFGLTADKQGVNIFYNKSGSWEVANFTSFKTYPYSIATISTSSSAAQVQAAFTPVGFVNPTIPNLGDHIQIQNEDSNNGAMFYYVEHLAGVVLRLLFCPTPEYVYYMTVDTSAWTVDKVEKFQISKLDDLIEWVGTPQDARGADSVFGRIKALEYINSWKDVLVGAGATYNEGNNTYSVFDEVMSFSQAVKSYIKTLYLRMATTWQRANTQGDEFVVNFPMAGFYSTALGNGVSMSEFSYFCLIKKFNGKYNENLFVKPNIFNRAFVQCTQLTTVEYIDLSLINTDLTTPFPGCTNLIDVKLKNLKVSISFSDSPLLTVKDDENSSLYYIVENSANTGPITITLHPDAFVKLEESMIQKAQAKQISIVSA